MLWQPALPEKYYGMTEGSVVQAIESRRRQLGDDLLILGHHYQRDDVIAHADLRGDSLKLSQMAAKESRKRGTKFIIFCGVHFMAETAEILTDEDVQVILPDLSAGCSMADMADYDDTVQAWEEIHEALSQNTLPPGKGSVKGKGKRPRTRTTSGSPRGGIWRSTRVIPITYVNSAAAIKAFVGEHGGACCTSSNAKHIFEWALDGGTQPRAEDEDIRIIFLPDQHLGRNTASSFGLLTEVDEAAGRGESETAVWNPRKDRGGLTNEQVQRAKVILWAGHCSVHKLFRPEHVEEAREKFADVGGVTVLVHPECCKEVVDVADLSGSTEFIIKTINAAEPGTNWSVGTEVHLVNRLAREAKARGVNVTMLSDCQCLCTTMYRIEPRNLLWVLDNLADERVVNRIEVTPRVRELSLLSLQRMLAHVSAPAVMPALVD